MSRESNFPDKTERESLWLGLVNRIADGDEAAFSEFYDQTRLPVYALIVRIVSLAPVAEEVTMDVYLQVWRQASHYREYRGSVYTWLMLLSRSRALDRLRSERRWSAYNWIDFTEGFDITDMAHSPESLAQVKQTRSRMSEIFRDLPEEQRQVIELSFYEGMSHGEIADRLQWPLGTVKTRIRTAIDKFRKVLV